MFITVETTVETRVSFKLPQEYDLWEKWAEDNNESLSKWRMQKTTTGITYVNVDWYKVGEDGEA